MTALLLLALAHAALPPAPPAKAEINGMMPAINVLCWPSGLQVVAVRDDAATHAAIAMVVQGGSGADDPAARGAAHLLEHLWFRATPGSGGVTVWDGMAGLEITASTRLDSTVYTTVGAASDLSALLALEGQRLVDPLVGVTAAVVASEREVVKSEQLYRGGATMELGRRLLEQALYPSGHPYHGALVTSADIDGLDLADVRAYAKRVYKPANTTIRLEGDVPVETDALAALIGGAMPDAVIAGLGSSCVHAAEPRVPEGPATTDLQVADAPVWNQRLLIGWTLPPAYSPSIDVMRHAAAVVSTQIDARLGFVSGLGGRDRDRAGGACAVHSGHVASELVCRIDVPQGIDAGEVLKVLRGLDTQWSTGSSLDEFVGDRMVSTWTGAMHDATSLDLDALEQRALWSHFADVHEPFSARLAAGAIEGEDVVAFGKKWLGVSRMAAALVRPVSTTLDPAAASVTWTPRLDAPPPRWAAVTSDPDAVVATSLDSGLAVWIAKGGGDAPGFVETSVVARGGTVNEPAPGLQAALEAMATWTPPIDLGAFRYGTVTSWWPVFGLYTTGTGGWSSTASLPAQMWQSRLFLEELSLDSGRRQRTLDDMAGTFTDPDHALDYVLAAPWSIADWRRRGHLLGTTSAGLPWWERNHAARGVRVPDVTVWQGSVLQPKNAVVIVSGAVEPDPALATIEKYLGGWREKDAAAPGPGGDVGAPPAPQVELVPLVRSLTQVAVSCRVPARDREHEAALQVLEAVLERGLWQSLRDDGRTYTPDVWVEPAGSVSLLHVEAEVLPGQGVPALRTLVGLLRLVAEGKSTSAVAAAKVETASAYGRDMGDTSAAADRLAWTWAWGGSIDDVRDFPRRVEAVDTAAVAALLQGCVGHEAVTIVGADDPAAFEALGAPVVVHDAEELARLLAERMD